MCLVIPVLKYNDDEKTDNYELNVVRHAFSCSMRSVAPFIVIILHEK
jgi:hypothetical protein